MSEKILHSELYKFAPGDTVVDKNTKEYGVVKSVEFKAVGSGVAVVSVYFFRKELVKTMNVVWGKNAPILRNVTSSLTSAASSAYDNIKSKTINDVNNVKFSTVRKKEPLTYEEARAKFRDLKENTYTKYKNQIREELFPFSIPSKVTFTAPSLVDSSWTPPSIFTDLNSFLHLPYHDGVHELDTNPHIVSALESALGINNTASFKNIFNDVIFRTSSSIDSKRQLSISKRDQLGITIRDLKKKSIELAKERKRIGQDQFTREELDIDARLKQLSRNLAKSKKEASSLRRLSKIEERHAALLNDSDSLLDNSITGMLHKHRLLDDYADYLEQDEFAFGKLKKSNAVKILSGYYKRQLRSQAQLTTANRATSSSLEPYSEELPESGSMGSTEIIEQTYSRIDRMLGRENDSIQSPWYDNPELTFQRLEDYKRFSVEPLLQNRLPSIEGLLPGSPIVYTTLGDSFITQHKALMAMANDERNIQKRMLERIQSLESVIESTKEGIKLGHIPVEKGQSIIVMAQSRIKSIRASKYTQLTYNRNLYDLQSGKSGISNVLANPRRFENGSYLAQIYSMEGIENGRYLVHQVVPGDGVNNGFLSVGSVPLTKGSIQFPKFKLAEIPKTAGQLEREAAAENQIVSTVNSPISTLFKEVNLISSSSQTEIDLLAYAKSNFDSVEKNRQRILKAIENENKNEFPSPEKLANLQERLAAAEQSIQSFKSITGKRLSASKIDTDTLVQFLIDSSDRHISKLKTESGTSGLMTALGIVDAGDKDAFNAELISQYLGLIKSHSFTKNSVNIDKLTSSLFRKALVLTTMTGEGQVGNEFGRSKLHASISSLETRMQTIEHSIVESIKTSSPDIDFYALQEAKKLQLLRHSGYIKSSQELLNLKNIRDALPKSDSVSAAGSTEESIDVLAQQYINDGDTVEKARSRAEEIIYNKASQNSTPLEQRVNLQELENAISSAPNGSIYHTSKNGKITRKYTAEIRAAKLNIEVPEGKSAKALNTALEEYITTSNPTERSTKRLLIETLGFLPDKPERTVMSSAIKEITGNDLLDVSSRTFDIKMQEVVNDFMSVFKYDGSIDTRSLHASGGQLINLTTISVPFKYFPEKSTEPVTLTLRLNRDGQTTFLGSSNEMVSIGKWNAKSELPIPLVELNHALLPYKGIPTHILGTEELPVSKVNIGGNTTYVRNSPEEVGKALETAKKFFGNTKLNNNHLGLDVETFNHNGTETLGNLYYKKGSNIGKSFYTSEYLTHLQTYVPPAMQGREDLLEIVNNNLDLTKLPESFVDSRQNRSKIFEDIDAGIESHVNQYNLNLSHNELKDIKYILSQRAKAELLQRSKGKKVTIDQLHAEVLKLGDAVTNNPELTISGQNINFDIEQLSKISPKLSEATRFDYQDILPILESESRTSNNTLAYNQEEVIARLTGEEYRETHLAQYDTEDIIETIFSKRSILQNKSTVEGVSTNRNVIFQGRSFTVVGGYTSQVQNEKDFGLKLLEDTYGLPNVERPTVNISLSRASAGLPQGMFSITDENIGKFNIAQKETRKSERFRRLFQFKDLEGDIASNFHESENISSISNWKKAFNRELTLSNLVLDAKKKAEADNKSIHHYMGIAADNLLGNSSEESHSMGKYIHNYLLKNDEGMSGNRLMSTLLDMNEGLKHIEEHHLPVINKIANLNLLPEVQRNMARNYFDTVYENSPHIPRQTLEDTLLDTSKMAKSRDFLNSPITNYGVPASTLDSAAFKVLQEKATQQNLDFIRSTAHEPMHVSNENLENALSRSAEYIESVTTKSINIKKHFTENLGEMIDTVFNNNTVKKSIPLAAIAAALGIGYLATHQPDLGHEADESKAHMEGEYSPSEKEKHIVLTPVQQSRRESMLIKSTGSASGPLNSKVFNTMVASVMAKTVPIQNTEVQNIDTRDTLNKPNNNRKTRKDYRL